MKASTCRIFRLLAVTISRPVYSSALMLTASWGLREKPKMPCNALVTSSGEAYSSWKICSSGMRTLFPSNSVINFSTSATSFGRPLTRIELLPASGVIRTGPWPPRPPRPAAMTCVSDCASCRASPSSSGIMCTISPVSTSSSTMRISSAASSWYSSGANTNKRFVAGSAKTAV